MIARTALAASLVLVLAGCGGAARPDGQRTQSAQEEFLAFCEDNPGACDEPAPAGRPSQFSPAVSVRGWKRSSCPRAVLDPGPRAPEDVVRAMRAAVPRLIRVSAYGRESRLVAANTVVLDVRPLRSDDVDLPGIETLQAFSAYYERAARRLCGATVARRSWGVILQFPEAQGVALAYRVMFLARTAAGWKAWYPRSERLPRRPAAP